jgi:glucose/arabinose dehydrogenase
VPTIKRIICSLAVLALVLPAMAQEADLVDIELELELFAEGFTSPVFITPLPDGSGQFIVLDQIGVAYLVTGEGQRLDEPFLDLRDRMVELREAFDERGLLGIAFHPNYAENRRFYVHYSAPLRDQAPQNWDHTAHISEFLVSQDDPNMADLDTERVVLQVDQPQFNHDGGSIAFGPDGYLYIALGDGGGANDTAMGHPPIGHGQDYNTLLGSILRIDVDRGWPGYAIPQDNPLVGQEGRDEIYAWGMRNPYRMSFDVETGDLYVGDVGQILWEIVNLVNQPGNYGWNIKEGTHCFDPAQNWEPAADCPDVGPHGWPLIDPVIEYPNTGPRDNVTIHGDQEVGTTVIGGYVYRGTAIPELQGMYVFGDWTANRNEAAGVIFVAAPEDAGLWSWQQLHRFDGSYVLSFGQGEDNELFVAVIDSRGPTGESGRIYRLVSGSN